MKKIIISVSVVVFIGLAGLFVFMKALDRDNPQVLLEKIQKGDGDLADLTMRLNVARGDVNAALIQAYDKAVDDPQFRATVIELLFKQYYRSPTPEAKASLEKALKDPSAEVRRSVVSGMSIYFEDREQTVIADYVEDSDAEVRRQVYTILTTADSWNHEKKGIWGYLEKDVRERLVEICRNRFEKETDPEMQYLVRAVVGRQIETLCSEATELMQQGRLDEAETLLREAIGLDPENLQPRVRLARFFFSTGREEEGVAEAEKQQALLKIPRLSQAPVIDGDPSEAVWEEGAYSDRFFRTNSLWFQRLSKGKTAFRIGHFEGRLYIALWGYEKDIGRIKATYRERDSAVYKDDSIELFFSPQNDGRTNYQFVVNALGALFDKATNGGTKRNFSCEKAAAVFRDKGFWACEFSIDGNELDKHPIEPGKVWSLNIMRARIGAAESEQCAWWPTYGNSHRYENYPLAIFEE